MRVWQRTDRGALRKENQDNCGAIAVGAYTVTVVCDGMGGEKAGAVASEMARDVFLSVLESSIESARTQDEIAAAGCRAAEQANAAIYEKAQSDERYSGMGTTLVAAVTHGAQAIIFNVGDSRAYLIRGTEIRALTRDHSYVQEMLERGEITQEEALRHPYRKYITRAVGTDASVCCDTFPLTMERGDVLLLCSDGVTNTMEESELLYYVREISPLETAADRLIDQALLREARDNVTVILMEYEKEAEK